MKRIAWTSVLVLGFLAAWELIARVGVVHASWLVFVKEHPRGTFDVVVGLAGLIGLWLAVVSERAARESKREALSAVHTFEDLIDRLCEMAGKATAEHPLRILAYTASIGYIAQPTEQWNRLHEALRRRVNGRPVTKIICLRQSDLDVWHKLFVGRVTLRGEITADVAEAATLAANTLLDELQRDGFGNVIPDAVARLPRYFMPGFYLFFIRNRAMIISPLFFPFPRGAPQKLQETLPTVQMIGLDTPDRAVIAQVEQLYRYYSSLPQSSLGEGDCEVTASELDSWLVVKTRADAAVSIMCDQLLATYQKARVGPYAPLLKSSETIELQLTAHLKTWG